MFNNIKIYFLLYVGLIIILNNFFYFKNKKQNKIKIIIINKIYNYINIFFLYIY